MRAHVRSIAIISCGVVSALGCSSSDPGGSPADGGTANSSAGQAGASNPGGGGAASGNNTQSGGASAQAGGAPITAGAAGQVGTGGAPAAGGAPAVGGAPASAGSGGVDPLDTPPLRPLNVTVGGNKQITHGGVGGLQSAGIDTRAKQLGKLVVDLGVNSGGYQPWLGKRGFHSIGLSFAMCDINLNTREHDGDCRLNTFDGKPHGTSNGTSEANSMATKVKNGLTALHAMFPTEDWGYFLNQDGSVRWSDVAFSGMSHGSTTAAVIGKSVRLYRVVSRSGPRDNSCGLPGMAMGDFSRTTPPWKANCPDANVAAWLDLPPATPVNRFYAFVGMMDVEYGDIMFAMERMKYPGDPVRWDVAANVLTGTNRFYSNAGHLDFLSAADMSKPVRTDDALEIAFGVPEANRHPAF